MLFLTKATKRKIVYAMAVENIRGATNSSAVNNQIL